MIFGDASVQTDSSPSVTADKLFQGTDEGFDHPVTSKSVSGFTSMISDFQALSASICQKFERMSEVEVLSHVKS
jgi:hypothetical protein